MFVRSKIWTKTVDLRSNETLLGELHCVSSGDLFNLTLRVLLGINLDTTLGTTERNIGDSELECHQRGKSHDFLKINSSVVSCATLNWKFVVLVLSAVASDGLDLTIVTTDGDGESDDIVAGADQFEVVF